MRTWQMAAVWAVMRVLGLARSGAGESALPGEPMAAGCRMSGAAGVRMPGLWAHVRREAKMPPGQTAGPVAAMKFPPGMIKPTAVGMTQKACMRQADGRKYRKNAAAFRCDLSEMTQERLTAENGGCR